MSCRETAAGSALTTYARLVNGSVLSDPAVLSCFHDLRRQYTQSDESTRRTYTRDDYLGLLDRQRARINNRAGQFSEARRRSMLERIDRAAAADTPPQDVLYALHNITPTVRDRTTALRTFLTSAAERMGMPYAEVEARYQQLEGSVERSRSRTAPDGYGDASIALADRLGVGRDVAMVSAVARLNEEANAVEITRARALPQRVVRANFSSASPTHAGGTHMVAAGYDPSDGRLEVQIYSPATNETTTHYYHGVPRELGEEIASGTSSSGSRWAEFVRADPALQYRDEHEAALAGVANRCGDCGQFAAAYHSCPAAAMPEPRRMRQYQTAMRWSRQRFPIRRNATTYNVQTGQRELVPDQEVEAELRLPAVRELREAVSAGPVNIEGVSYSTMEYGLTDEGRLTYHRSNTYGNVIVHRNEDGTLAFNMANCRCNCEEYRNNHGHCRHLDEMAEGIRTRIQPAPRTPRAARTPEERERLLREAQERVERASANDWTRNEETLAEAASLWRRDSDTLYSETPDAFRADVNAALERAAAKNGAPDIPYMTENALDGMATRESGQAFGMEIEFEFPPSMDYSERRRAIERIGQELYDAGLTYDARQQGYAASKRRGFRDTHKDENGVGNWSFESDGSVNGGELVSPGMYDEPETWENLKTATDILRRNGAIPSKKAGAHVHVGTASYGGSPAAYTELARFMTQHEDAFYRLASDPSRGTHRNNGYSKRLPAVPGEGFGDVSSIRRWQPGRYSSINFAGVTGTDGDHPEFRLFDSTLDAGAMQTQIKLAVATVNAAKRASDAGGTRRGQESWGSHKERGAARGSRRRMTDEEFDADTATTRSMIDTLFRRREDKAQVAAVFAHTKWMKGR